jgi:heme-degrading monooxygenase HmoA
MFARVISAQSPPDGLDGVIRFMEEQLPQAQAQPGFKGFYLLSNRDTGDLVTISLWDTQESAKPVEARAARLTSQAAQSLGVTSDPVKVYQVEVARPA